MSDHQRNIGPAHAAPRCSYVRANGLRCGAPARRGQELCHYHNLAVNPPKLADFPALEDGDAVLIAFSQLARAIASGNIDPKLIWPLIYCFQHASRTLRYATTQPDLELARRKEVVRFSADVRSRRHRDRDEHRAELAVKVHTGRVASNKVFEEQPFDPAYSQVIFAGVLDDPRLAANGFAAASTTEKLLRAIGNDYTTPSAELFLRHPGEDLSTMKLSRRFITEGLARWQDAKRATAKSPPATVPSPAAPGSSRASA